MMKVEIKEVNMRDMYWCGIRDWVRLCPSETNILGTECITREDVFRFYDFVVRDIARKLGQDYKEVKRIMDEENQPFIQYVDQIFTKKKMYTKDAMQIRELRGLLIAPQTDANLTCMYRLYSSLSYEEKQAFREKIDS